VFLNLAIHTLTSIAGIANRRNYVSNTMNIPSSKDIEGSRDSYASGFQQRNGPNDYVRNIAVGNEGDGFNFDNDYKLILEVR